MIHRFALGGQYIVVDTYSGSVHVVDEVAYDVIGCYDEGKSREETMALLLEKYAGRTDVTIADISDCFDDL